jgi:hypothetical protein
MYRKTTNEKDIAKLQKDLDRGVGNKKWDKNKTR